MDFSKYMAGVARQRAISREGDASKDTSLNQAVQAVAAHLDRIGFLLESVVAALEKEE